jgi:hypothetical protein
MAPGLRVIKRGPVVNRYNGRRMKKFLRSRFPSAAGLLRSDDGDYPFRALGAATGRPMLLVATHPVAAPDP